eukprot:TRINITY_DN279_c1_g1_i1.p1 TRINITY_DN279_c1_g1~~TRINITY_DN279_c1_g1_i1.p1  ORF type:complete len:423 (-),score=128.14 TRINITY_DN279_c1_g1_i1:76-1344(-)
MAQGSESSSSGGGGGGAEDRSVSLFRDFIRIRTDHPTPKYHDAIEFLKNIASEIGLETEEVEPYANKPILIVKWTGKQPNLPSILLNSHTDVVPAKEEAWKVGPFDAYKDDDGNIYGRGTQDMKCVAIQYLEAIRRLKSSGVSCLLRTVYVTYMPDEEIGGAYGMGYFIKHESFQKMNVGMCLDEGLASPSDSFTVFYGERLPCWVRITAKGPTGHGSRFVENTAVVQLLRCVDELLAIRQREFEKLHKGEHECGKKLGDVTTLNITMLNAGVSSDGGKTYSLNVIPTEAQAGLDIRIPPSDVDSFLSQLRSLTSGLGLELQYETPLVLPCNVSSTSPDDVWWNRFQHACSILNIKTEKEIFPAATDSRYIRTLGIPAFGFSPINNTPILLHDHNEFLNEHVFLRGIAIYCTLISELANVSV